MAPKHPSWLHSHVRDRWKDNRFYDRLSDYDLFYIDLSKGMYIVLKESTFLPQIATGIMDSEIADLAVLIASWYEDFINEAGLWKAFTHRHQTIAGRPLPFWDLSDYDPEFLNWQDLAMLLWAWSRRILPGKFQDPMSDAFILQAKLLATLLDTTVEMAPASNDWDEFLELKETDGFKQLRGKLLWLGFKSYLFGQLDFVLRDAVIQEKLRKSAPDQGELYYKNVGYDIKLEVLFNFVTQFGGERLPVLASQILRGKPDVLAHVAACSEKIPGTFWLESSDAEYHFLREKETGRRLKVKRESADLKPEKGRIIRTSLIKWRGEFWIGGVSSQEVGAEPKPKGNGYLPLGLGTEAEVTAILDMLADEYECFIAKFGGPLKQCSTPAMAEESLLAYYTALEEITAAKFRRNAEEVVGPKLPDYAPDEPVALFYEKGRGLLISADAGYVIDFLNRKPRDANEMKEAFMNLFLECPASIVHYKAQHHSLSPLRIPGFKFDVATNAAVLCWFMNPTGAGRSKPNVDITVKPD